MEAAGIEPAQRSPRLSLAFPGSTDDEKRLHLLVDKHRIRGEWFRPEPEVLALVAKGRA
jgi:hypothetical protein